MGLVVKTWAVVGLAAMAALPSPALASVNCSGFVTTIRVETDGRLRVDFGSGSAGLCNVSSGAVPSGWTAVTASTCQMVMSQALTAMGTHRTFLVNLPTSTDCSSLVLGSGWIKEQPSLHSVQD